MTLETIIKKMSIYIQGARKRKKHREVDDYRQRLHKYQAELNLLLSRHAASC